MFIPGSVMHGFTLGVAFIISANQLNFLLGLPKLKRHPEFVANLYETLNNIGLTSSFAVGFFVVAFGSLFTLARRYGKIPWAVVLAIIGIAIGAVADATKSTLPLQTIRTQYGDLSLQLVRLSEIFTEGLDASLEIWLDLLRGAVSIAAVAVLETLISARIADRMTKTLFDQRQEVMSVALSNLASGFTGGIPATAALARTALNVKSGATSRASGIVNGVAIIILSTALFSAFKYLPLPVVAAILVNTAYRMIEFHEIEIMYKTDKPSFVVCCITGLICVVEDPTMGIVYGTFLAMIRLLLAMIHGHATLQIFKGTRSELLWVFDQNDRKSLKKVRAKFTKETDPEELAAAEKHAAAEKAAGLPSTFLLQAAHALRAASVKAAEKKIPEPEVMETGINPEGHYYTVASDRDVDSRLPKVAVYSLTGYFTYIAAQSHLDRIRGLFLEPNTRLPDVDVVAFSLVECYYADPDALDALGDVIGVSILCMAAAPLAPCPLPVAPFLRIAILLLPPVCVQELTRANKSVFLLGFHTRVSRVLHKLPWFPRQVTFPDYGTLLLHLRDILRLDDEKRRTPAAADMSFADFVAEKTANGTLLSSLSPEFVHKTIGHTDASDSDTDDDGHANNPAVRAAAQRRASLAAATAAAATATPFHSSLGASAGAGVGLSPVQHSWSSPRGAATAAAAAAVPAMALAASTASDPAASHGAHAAAPAAAAASPASAAVAVPLHNTSDHEAVWSSTAVAAATETAATTSTTAAAAAPSPFDKEWQ